VKITDVAQVTRPYRICVMRGDGIGPEIMDAALLVLNSISKVFGLKFSYVEVPAGDAALRDYGDALPQKSIEAFASSDACLKGPVGETIMDLNNKLRFGFDLYANLRPAKSYPGICPPALKPDIDLVVIRENSEGFYRALEAEVEPGIWTNTGVFTEKAARRIAELSFRLSRSRRRKSEQEKARKVTLATKTNIFRNTHGMYLRIFTELAESYHDIGFEHYYADALCAALVRQPEKFDIITSENLLADLLSDLAGQVAGGLGMTPGTNINYETKHAYFEPTHGSAPDIAGTGVANPIGQIRSAALMLEYLGFVHEDDRAVRAAEAVESAIESLLNSHDRSKFPRELGGEANTRAVARSVAALISSSKGWSKLRQSC